MVSQLDPGQIIKAAYDDASGRIKVTGELTANISAAQQIIITHADDSIKIGDGTNLVTTTQVSSDYGLDVNVIGGTLTGTFTPTGLFTSIKSTVITVTDVATKLPTTSLTNRNSMSVRVWGANTVFFGSNTVTSAAGYPKRQYEEISMDVQDDAGVELYGICTAGQTSEVRIIEVA